jgi:hypothetical protein
MEADTVTELVGLSDADDNAVLVGVAIMVLDKVVVVETSSDGDNVPVIVRDRLSDTERSSDLDGVRERLRDGVFEVECA